MQYNRTNATTDVNKIVTRVPATIILL